MANRIAGFYRFLYVSGTARDKNGVGVAVSGEEDLRLPENPWTALEEPEIRRLLEMAALGQAAVSRNDVCIRTVTATGVCQQHRRVPRGRLGIAQQRTDVASLGLPGERHAGLAAEQLDPVGRIHRMTADFALCRKSRLMHPFSTKGPQDAQDSAGHVTGWTRLPAVRMSPAAFTSRRIWDFPSQIIRDLALLSLPVGYIFGTSELQSAIWQCNAINDFAFCNSRHSVNIPTSYTVNERHGAYGLRRTGLVLFGRLNTVVVIVDLLDDVSGMTFGHVQGKIKVLLFLSRQFSEPGIST